MTHYFNSNGFTVLQFLGYRLQIVNRKRNPIISSVQFPAYQPHEYRVWKYGISFYRV